MGRATPVLPALRRVRARPLVLATEELALAAAGELVDRSGLGAARRSHRAPAGRCEGARATLAGHSYDEIAEHLGVTYTNVNRQLVRARPAMRAGRGDDPPGALTQTVAPASECCTLITANGPGDRAFRI
jgi:hypothetical protein